MDFDLVGTNVLGDAAGLTFGNARRTNRVQQLGFAVVDVAHDRDDRRAGAQIGGFFRRQHVLHILDHASQLWRDVFFGFDIEIGRDQRRSVVVDLLVDVRQHT
ncbi:hypothetical protein SE17_23510, partial [Kouleothrix aurantiaca]